MKKRGSTLFLQMVIILFGIGALAFLLWEPTVEGVNAGATFSQIYSTTRSCYTPIPHQFSFL